MHITFFPWLLQNKKPEWLFFKSIFFLLLLPIVFWLFLSFPSSCAGRISLAMQYFFYINVRANSILALRSVAKLVGCKGMYYLNLKEKFENCSVCSTWCLCSMVSRASAGVGRVNNSPEHGGQVRNSFMFQDFCTHFLK